MKEGLLDKQKSFVQSPLHFEKSANLLDASIFIVSFALFFVTLVCGFNFLTLVCVLLSMFLGLVMMISLLRFNKINVFRFASYGLLLFGTAFVYICRGADSFGYRLGYNLMVVLLALIAYIIVGILPYVKIEKVKFYLSRIGIALMIVGSLCYFLFMNIRLKPTVERMWEGQENYLNDIKNNHQVDAAKPNVLVVLMDDMAYSDISSYSYMSEKDATIKTPNIDSIGKNGIMMDNCYSSSPVSSPSRFGILTGRYSARGYLDNVVFPTAQQVAPFGSTRFFNAFQFQNNVDGILGDEITVAEAMQSSGYHTGLFGKWNLGDYGEYLPTNQGFDYFFGSHYVNDMTPYNVVRESNGKFEEVYSHNDMLDQSLSTSRFTSEVNGFIDESIASGEKFFAQYWSPWPHFPIFSNFNGNGVGDKSDDSYIDCIQEFDKSMGEIIKNLKTKGIYDDTLIIFTSDNGPGREGVTGALRGRKNTPFEGAHKVPFLACYPNGDIGDAMTADADGNKRITSRCTNMDVFNTILDYAALPLPTDRVIDGVSMRALWNGSIAQDKDVHKSIFYLKGGKVKGVNMPILTTYTEYRVDLSGNIVPDVKNKVYDFKYYKDVQTENSAFFNQHYKNYLFNLDTDQAEGYNIAMNRPDLVNTLKNEFERFEKELKVNRRGIL